MESAVRVQRSDGALPSGTFVQRGDENLPGLAEVLLDEKPLPDHSLRFREWKALAVVLGIPVAWLLVYTVLRRKLWLRKQCFGEGRLIADTPAQPALWMAILVCLYAFLSVKYPPR